MVGVRGERWLPPRVGMVGAGQLARMTYQAAISLGVHLRVLAAAPGDGAALCAADVTVGAATDWAVLEPFARGSHVLTFDHELVDVGQLRRLEEAGCVVRPSAATVEVAQDKVRQRAGLAAMGAPAPAFRPVARAGEVEAFAEEQGWPVVVKAARGGYDGRGVWVVEGAEQARALVAEVGGRLRLLVERWVPLEREIAAMVARRPGGQAVAYPVVETVQVGGICHELLAPAPLEPALAAEAQALALRIAERLGVVGILAVELFVSGGTILVNELAARPHNSGHHTIEGCHTSQFENHLRAVLDWPLGLPTLVAPAVATANVLGGADGVDPLLRLPEALAVEGASVHLYGKRARPGRKLGHVTVVGDDPADVRQRARWAARLLVGE